ncbi:uncharacterized protein JCM10292_005683 [Rhodotorula paludigena]|uniref:uncharacterized protein n=1 Tax=Rhodotorula paludigena TaxID=86838 RepID=UPI0031746278
MASSPPAPHPLVPRLVPLVDSHPLRIASHSHIHATVHWALAHLQDPANPPLVLHTLPPPPPAAASSSSSSTSTIAPLSAPTLAHATAALPKLVSVAELVKRQFAHVSSAPTTGESLELGLEDATRAVKGKRTPRGPEGLHQYTLLTSYEALGAAPPDPAGARGADEQEDADAEELERMRRELVQLEWLTGRAGKQRRPRRKHTPCMLIVLSRSPLDELETLSSAWTHQPPLAVRANKKSRSTEDAAAASTSKVKKRPHGDGNSAAVPLSASGAASADERGEGDEAGEGQGKKRVRRRRRRRGAQRAEDGVEEGAADGMQVDAQGGEVAK